MKTAAEIILNKFPYANSVDWYKPIIEAMEEYANQSKWISVETEKPEDREYVDCYLSEEINGKNFAYSTYSKKYGFENVPNRIVTHFRRPEKP